MAALNRLCAAPDDFAGASTAGASLPFLPTLVVAALIGAGALCWDSVKPATAPSGPAVVASVPLPQMARMSLDSRPSDAEGSTRLPAGLAFAELVPVVFEAPSAVAARAEPRSPARMVRIAPPTGCAGQRCRDGTTQTASAPLRRPHVVATVPPAAGPFASAEAEDALVEAVSADQPLPDKARPDRALPFAPTLSPAIRIFQRTVGFVGAQASALGTEASALGTEAVALCGAVTDFAGGLR